MTQFSLHRLVRQTIDDLPEIADPGILADRVFGQLTTDQYADAITTMLRSYVRRVLAEDRSTQADEPDPQAQGDEPVRAPAAANKSAYRTAMQAGAWRARLGERIHGATGWLLLRDCGLDDLKAAAAERRELAAANIRSADELERLQELLATAGVATVGELPDPVLRVVFAT
jgi:hypothetical protein